MKTNSMSANNVEHTYKFYVGLLFNRISNMFVWDGIPPSIDNDYLSYLVFCRGAATFFKINDTLYVADCKRGGEPNEYYLPQYMILANPILGSRNMKIGEECAVIWTSSTDKLFTSDSMIFNSICPTWALIDKTAHLLAECMCSLNIAQVNTRASYLITASNTTAKNSAELALKQVYGGKPFIVANENMVGDIKSLPLATSTGLNTVKELRELHQYYLSQFYRAIGVNSNSNFKRERVIESEMVAELEPLQINIKNMLESVTKGVDEVNKLFNTNITVKLSDEWQHTLEEEENGNAVNDVERSADSV